MSYFYLVAAEFNIATFIEKVNLVYFTLIDHHPLLDTMIKFAS
jgi:hypothetical protein